MILGEILGRNAGLTWEELILFLFLLFRPVAFGSARLLDIEPPGDGMIPSRGLEKLTPFAVDVALAGAVNGVLMADKVGVA